MDQSSIRVVVADEHFLFRRGLRTLLGRVSDIQVVDEAGSAQDAFDAVQRHSADLVLLDAALAKSDDQFVQSLSQACPHTRVILLLNPGSAEPPAALAESGAAGCLSRNSPPIEMIETVRKIGPEAVAARRNLTQDGDSWPKAVAPNDPRALTRRESEVLAMLMRGATSREIASTLSLSIKTIEAHRFNLMRKLDVHSRAELFKIGRQRQSRPPVNADQR